ncbi:MAG: hypothetical protein V1810_04555 [Candidatus Beckwithbacteria bacterium]
MKKLLIGLILSVIVIWPLFIPDFYQSHDGELHLARIAAYSQALKQGQFPVRWAANLNYNYGYPIFNFVYPLPYLLASGLNLLGFSVIVSLKTILGLSLVLSGIFMYLAVKIKLKNDWAGLAAATVYVLAPYRILNVYIRAALGETVAFIFAPLILLGYWKKNFWLMILGMVGLILSHNALALVFLGFLGLLMIKKIKTFILPLGLSLGLTAWFWLPSLLELKYTLAKVYLSQKDFHDYFVSLKDLVYMPWSFNGEQIPTYIGWLSIGIMALFIYQLIKKRVNRFFGWVLVAGWFFSLFFCTKYSVWWWEQLPLLAFFQLPWRWLSLTVLITAIAAGWIRFNKLIVILSIVLALPIIKVKPSDLINQIDFQNYPKTTTWHNEGSPVWTAGEADHYPTAPFEVIGQAEVTVWQRQDLKHEFKISSQEESRFIDNTVYFPGWRVIIDNQTAEIQFQDPSYRGLITFNIPQGNHQVEVIFTRTKVRLIAELISISSFAVLLLIFKRRRGITV